MSIKEHILKHLADETNTDEWEYSDRQFRLGFSSGMKMAATIAQKLESEKDKKDEASKYYAIL